MMETVNTEQKENELTLRIRNLANQEKPAAEMIELLIALLEVSTNYSERERIKSDLESLRNLTTVQQLFRKSLWEKIGFLKDDIKAKEKLLSELRQCYASIDNITELLALFQKRLEKIKFDEHSGFLWRMGGDDNISQLIDLSQQIAKMDAKGIKIFSGKDQVNTEVLKLYNHLTSFLKSSLFH